MQLSFWIIELVVFALAAMLIMHARKQGSRWLSTCLWAMAFGLVVELLIVVNAERSGQYYVYGDFWLMVGPAGKQVPIWVGVGWGVIVYAASFTAQRLRSPWILRPASAGLLAVNIDLSLDPIAEQLGFWSWHNVDPINYFGVPLDNFLGWFMIVTSFALSARLGFRLVPPGKWGAVFWVPGVAGVLALLLTILGQLFAGWVYTVPYGEMILFVLVFAGASALTWGFALKSRRDNPKNWPILTLPLTIHSVMLVFLFATGKFQEEPALMVVIPLGLVTGFFAYSWASIETLFPQAL